MKNLFLIMVKKNLVLFILLLLANFSYCQIDDNDGQFSKCDLYNQSFHCFYPEELPIYDNNFPKKTFEKLFEFLSENLTFPSTAKADKVEGQVFVEFWIDTNGFTSEHKIIQSVRQDLDDEALRVIRLIKFEEPAKNQGEPVGVCFQLPIRFTLDKQTKPSRNTKQSDKVKSSRKSQFKNNVNSSNGDNS